MITKSGNTVKWEFPLAHIHEYRGEERGARIEEKRNRKKEEGTRIRKRDQG